MSRTLRISIPHKIQEVVSTPVSLPVKERIAQGLSRGGTSNTFKVFAYNALFGSMAYFATGAIRQFCIFTVVVLVAHWFLIHTFFVAVLAIDIQRLEVRTSSLQYVLPLTIAYFYIACRPFAAGTEDRSVSPG